VHGKPGIAERLHLEFRIIHQRDMTVDVSLLPEDEFCESAVKRRQPDSIASGSPVSQARRGRSTARRTLRYSKAR
jgi:hypothetical protein